MLGGVTEIRRAAKKILLIQVESYCEGLDRICLVPEWNCFTSVVRVTALTYLILFFSDIGGTRTIHAHFNTKTCRVIFAKRHLHMASPESVGPPFTQQYKLWDYGTPFCKLWDQFAHPTQVVELGVYIAPFFS